jgi:hypothetical protein
MCLQSTLSGNLLIFQGMKIQAICDVMLDE